MLARLCPRSRQFALRPALEDHHAERRYGDVEQVRPAVARDRRRTDAAQVALAAPPVQGCIAVQHLLPAAALGHAAHASSLLGAATGVREEIGAPLAPADRQDYESTVATVRSALDHAFLPAWAAGRAMRLEQVVHTALGRAAAAASLTIESSTQHGLSPAMTGAILDGGS